MSFYFLDRIGELVGGPDSVIIETRGMLDTTHRITKAGSAAKIPVDNVRKHVVNALLDAIVDLAKVPLLREIDEHMGEVIEAATMMRGEPDGDGDALWWAETADEAFAAFEGDVATIAGEEAFKAAASEGKCEALTDLALERLARDPKKTLTACGITADLIEGLVKEVRGEKPTALQELSMGGFIAIARRERIAGKDIMELDEAVRAAFGATTKAEMEAAAALLTDNDVEQAQIFDFFDRRVDIPKAQDEKDIDHILERAMADDTAGDAIEIPSVVAAVATEEKTERKPRAGGAGRPRGGNEQSAATDAAKAALVALCAFSAIKENDLAAAIGVSRATMINYREGKTVWTPTAADVETLKSLFSRYIENLQEAQFLVEQHF